MDVAIAVERNFVIDAAGLQPAALRRFHQGLEMPLRSLVGCDAARAETRW
jgi:hypothetical protein